MAVMAYATEVKLKILALHGYRQNAEKFFESTELLRERVESFADIVYIQAPHPVLLVDDVFNLAKGEHVNGKQYGWFFNRNNCTNRGTRSGGPAIGFQETINIIEELNKSAGPFDGVMGFSQGACLTGLLCDLQHRSLISCKFKFAIMISGFKSKCLPHMKYYGEVLDIPSMHIIGETDDVIPKEMSEQLSEMFEEPLIVRHEGGHIVPITEMMDPFYEFIENQYMSSMPY